MTFFACYYIVLDLKIKKLTLIPLLVIILSITIVVNLVF
jgi:hypothetical protein